MWKAGCLSTPGVQGPSWGSFSDVVASMPGFIKTPKAQLMKAIAHDAEGRHGFALPQMVSMPVFSKLYEAQAT